MISKTVLLTQVKATAKRVLQLVAISLWALFAAPGQQAAAAPDTGAFRQDLAAVLDQWMDLSETLQANPVAADTLTARGTPTTALLAAAQWALLDATDEELAALEIAMEAAPGWRDWPGQLSPIVAKFAVVADGVSADLIPDVCSAAIAADITVSDRAVAEAVALAAGAFMEGFPTDGLTIAARLAPIALWAVAEGLAITATAFNDIKENCNGDTALANIQSSVDTVQSSLTTHNANIDGDIVTHNANIDGDIAAHDTNIDGDIVAHNANIDGDLAAHDADVKALLATVNDGIVQNKLLLEEVIDLLLTPQGRRDGFPLP